MKKVKLMLMSLCVLAVVAGALAFTARTSTHMCTAAYDTVNNTCPTTCPSFRKLKTSGNGTFICTAATVSSGSDECNNGGVIAQCNATSVQLPLE